VRRRLILAAALAIAASGCARNAPPADCGVRFSIPAPPGAEIAPRQIPAVSPDASQVAFTAAGTDGVARLWLHSLRRARAAVVPGTEGAAFPFWSPDGGQLGFFADSRLKRVDLASGAVQAIGDAPDPRGGSWSPNGIMIFSARTDGGTSRAIFSVPAAGGPIVRRTKAPQSDGEGGDSWPAFLPDGWHFVYSLVSANRLYLGSLRSSERVRFPGMSSPVAPVGRYLLIAAGDVLYAAAFDRKVLHVVDQPALVAGGVARGPARMASFGASRDGSMIVYGQAGTTIVWVDEAGRETAAVSGAGTYSTPALSPSTGDLLAFAGPSWIPFGTRIYGVYEPGADRWRRIPIAGARGVRPLWSADGTEIIVTTPSGGSRATIDAVRADGSGTKRKLFDVRSGSYAAAVSSRGGLIALVDPPETQEARSNIRVVPLSAAGSPDAAVVWRAPASTSASAPAFSADGRSIAYVSRERGRDDVFVADVAGQGTPVRISANGGASPVWTADGKRLFYRTPSGIAAVATDGPVATWSASERVVLDAAFLNRSRYVFDEFDVAHDGSRVLLQKSADPDAPAALVGLAACGGAPPATVFP
jgi:Tol biopolymer transport system component